MILPNITIPATTLIISGVAGIFGAVGGGFLIGAETIEQHDSQAVKIAKIVGGILLGAIMLGVMPIGIFGIIHIKGGVVGITLLVITILRNLQPD